MYLLYCSDTMRLTGSFTAEGLSDWVHKNIEDVTDADVEDLCRRISEGDHWNDEGKVMAAAIITCLKAAKVKKERTCHCTSLHFVDTILLLEFLSCPRN